MSSGPTAIRLSDVAHAVGVHASTVSRALHHPALVRPALRERIVRAAKELGYTPDAMLSRLASRRWTPEERSKREILAFVRWFEEGGEEAQWRRGAAEQATHLGYEMMDIVVPRFRSPAACSLTLYHRGIRGVVAGRILSEDQCLGFEFSRFAVVSAGVSRVTVPGPTVIPNGIMAVERALTEGEARGYRRPCAILFARLGRDGALYEGALRRRVKDILFIDEAASEAVRRRTCRWIAKRRSDLVLGFNEGVYWMLSQAGCRIPDDFGFIGLADSEDSPESAGLVLRSDEVGRQCVRQLDAQIRAGMRADQAHAIWVLVDPMWHEGGSVTVRRA